MKSIIKKLKNYKPPKYICYLYFFVPIIVSCITNVAKEEDIWFLLNHGKYLVHHGFPTIEPFTIHTNFAFVMQQWLSALVFYMSHFILGKYGLILVIVLVNLLILYFLYKLCMLLSNNKYTISTIVTCVTDVILLLFILPRPQIFTLLFLVIVLYIMELFYKNKNTKAIYFLILISLLQINFHAAMWPMIYLFMLPYLVNYIILYFKKKDKRLFKLLSIIVIMLLVQFINPYGIESIKYVFNSYGNKYINRIVYEMRATTFEIFQGQIFFTTLLILITIYIFYRKNKMQLRHFLLFIGVVVLALSNFRNVMLYVVGTIPFLAYYLKDLITDSKKTKIKDKLYKNKYIITISFLVIVSILSMIFISPSFNNKLKLDKGVNYLLKNNKKEDIVLYTGYDNGSYPEYRGIKVYMDTRAEVFLKSNNKKEDVFKEYYYLTYGLLDYDSFLEKYKFTHLLISKKERLYYIISVNKNYKKIFNTKKYSIFEKID